MGKSNKMEEIAKLLPENLDESVAIEIANLVSEKIVEEVSRVKSDLTAKVSGFIRGQVDRLKEQAIKELELENETFRNASLFEHIKNLFGVELMKEETEDKVANVFVEELSEMESKLETLASELDRVLSENVKYKSAIKLQSDKLEMLESENVELTETLNSFKQSIKEEKSRKKVETRGDAFVISEENFKTRREPTETKKSNSGNTYLTEEVLNLMMKD